MSRKPKTTATNEQTKTALVPMLRFPEFCKAAGWKGEKVDELVDTVTPPKKLPTSTYASMGEFPIIDQSQSDICGWTDDKEALIDDGLPLIVFGDHTCILKLLARPFAQGADGIKILKSRSKVGTPFLYHFLSYRPIATEKYKRHYSILKEKRVFFPEFNSGEQQKIAECLSSVDDVIAAQARKLDVLKSHKKVLMQQLFPGEGRIQPRLRFPEFQDDGGWVTEPLGELTSYQNGKAYEQDIKESGKYIVVNSRFISTDGAVRKYSNADYLIAEAGEVLMVLSDLPKGKALAKCYFVEANDRYAVNQRVCRLTPKRIEGKFLYYALNRHPRLLAFDDGLNQTHLSKASVTECPLCVPEANAEQHRIAACLSSLDALIAAETQKHALLQRHKRGLMQQLFPTPEELEA